MSGSPAAATDRQAPPALAAEVFGARLDAACRYADLLCSAGVERGLIGPHEPARIWTRHLLNAAALAAFIPEHATVIDLGSGAGLPGIPLLLARPDLDVTLVEPMLRRAAFCTEVRDALGLRLTVVRARAEQVPPASAQVVVARAVAPLGRLATLALPLLRPGGVLLALKGAGAAAEVAAAHGPLRAMGAGEVTVHPIGTDEDRTYVVRVCAPEVAIRFPRGDRTRRGAR